MASSFMLRVGCADYVDASKPVTVRSARQHRALPRPLLNIRPTSAIEKHNIFLLWSQSTKKRACIADAISYSSRSAGIVQRQTYRMRKRRTRNRL